jgi:hypothetical protein
MLFVDILGDILLSKSGTEQENPEVFLAAVMMSRKSETNAQNGKHSNIKKRKENLDQ